MTPELKYLSAAGLPLDRETTLRIPGNIFKRRREEIIDTRWGLLEGDLTGVSGISNQIKAEVKDFSKSPDFLKNMVELGARVLKTEKESLLVIHSEESLEYSKEIQKPKKQEVEILGRKVVIKTEFHPFKSDNPYTTYSVNTLVDGKEWDGKYYYQSGKMIKGPWKGTYFQGGMGGITIETDPGKVIEHIVNSVIDLAQNPRKPSVITG